MKRIDLRDLETIAIKSKDPNDQQLLFSTIQEIEELRRKNRELQSEVASLRSDGKKTHYERQREIEDEIYYRQHGNLGMK